MQANEQHEKIEYICEKYASCSVRFCFLNRDVLQIAGMENEAIV